MEARDDIQAEAGKSHQGAFQSQRYDEQLWPEVAPCASIRRSGRSESDQTPAEVLETPLPANGRENQSGAVVWRVDPRRVAVQGFLGSAPNG
jgi:hypothetical protein